MRRRAPEARSRAFGRGGIARFGWHLALAGLLVLCASAGPAPADQVPVGASPAVGPVLEKAALSAPVSLSAPRLAVFDRAVRGVTIGPIENALHPDRGYGTTSAAQCLHSVARMGANWVSLTPFGRVWSLTPQGIDLDFETPFSANRDALVKTIRDAHALGLKVMLVPHLWVETGEWRALIDPGDDEAWGLWARAYEKFVTTWARVAATEDVELFSVGVELRSWVTTRHAPSFVQVIRKVREIYSGPLTYAANWDDVEHTTILSELDVIGINAFYPLAQQDGSSFQELLDGGKALVPRLRQLSQSWRKPIVFTEFGYTARDNPAVRPWEWPEDLHGVSENGLAQAQAYAALLANFVEEDWFLGFFMWRVYADYYDASQEPPWGFSPLHREAELVLRAAFTTHWAADGLRPLGASLGRPWPLGIGRY